MKSKEIASGEDFRKCAEAEAWEEPRRVVLPKSGFAVLLRRPTKLYWGLRRSEWPRELAEKLDMIDVGVKTDLTPDQKWLLVQEEMRMLKESFVNPKPALEPGPGQFNTDWLLKEDVRFILKYLHGQVEANSQEPAADGLNACEATGSSGVASRRSLLN